MQTDPHEKRTYRLENYPKQRNARLVKEVCEQPLLSPEESMKQLKRLANQSRIK